MRFVLRPMKPLWVVCLAALCWVTGVVAAERNLAVAATKSQPLSEPRIALVIGNSDYANAPLPNPVNDARAIADRLVELRFRVVRLENATQEQMYEGIRAFGDALRGGGVGFFFYAGHALQVRGRNYLLPARTNIAREDEILYRTVDTGQILDKMESARNRVNIVILDACRNNPFGREFRTVTPGLAVVDAPFNTLIAFATAPGAVASDGSGRNGLYTQHLLRSLAVPGLSLEDVFKRVRTGVRQESAGRQVPWESTSIEVDFYFDPLPHQMAAATTPATDPLIVELAFWDSVKGSNDPEDFRAYLRRYPAGQFVVLASNRLRLLSGPAPPSQAPSPPPAAVATLTVPPTLATPAKPSPAIVSGPMAAATLPAVLPGLSSLPPPLAGPTAAPVPSLAPAPAPAAVAALAPAPAGPPGTAAAAEPLRALAGHTGEVLAVSVSRNGRHALTGGADRSLRYWDLSIGRELRRFTGHAAAVTATAIGADPRHFLSGSADRTVRLWDAASGGELLRMEAHAAAVSAVALGPTARYAVSAATDGELVLWELPAGNVTRRASADQQRVNSVALSPEGRFLVTASEDGVVRLWDVGSLNILRTYGPMSGPAASAAFTEDGRRINAADRRGEVWTWETQSGALVHRFGTGLSTPGQVAIATDGATALMAGADGRLALWDIGSGQAVWRSGAAERPVTAVAAGPRGSIGVSAGDDKRLLLWSVGR